MSKTDLVVYRARDLFSRFFHFVIFVLMVFIVAITLYSNSELKSEVAVLQAKNSELVAKQEFLRTNLKSAATSLNRCAVTLDKISSDPYFVAKDWSIRRYNDTIEATTNARDWFVETTGIGDGK